MQDAQKALYLKNVKYPETTPPPVPKWMKVRLRMNESSDNAAGRVKERVKGARLYTVCEEASCPNLGHCWAQGTATFMIMGDTCTRRCGFCDIATAKPLPLDPEEPARLAQTIRDMRLNHAVITSVDRDDQKDCGSAHFAEAIRLTREAAPYTILEVLIPDFKAREENLQRIWDARPHIINHNVETVPSLFKTICPQSNYANSLVTLRLSAERGFIAKSGIILGLGEELDEVRQVIRDLRDNGTVMLTIGQYLQPTRKHAPLHAYIPVEVFDELKDYAYEQGFQHVESGPLVRSSYHAGESFAKLMERLEPGKIAEYLQQ